MARAIRIGREQRYRVAAGGEMRRPTPERVREILRTLLHAQEEVFLPALVAAIQRETGVSRATAYRAVADARAAGTITGGAS